VLSKYLSKKPMFELAFFWAAKISNMKSIRPGFYFDWHLESLNISFALLRIKLKEIWIN